MAGSTAIGFGDYLVGGTEVEHYDSELTQKCEEVKRVLKLKK